MEWIKIDKNNLPEKEVLAANFKSHTLGYKDKILGYLEKSEKTIICANNDDYLENCTHYIPINDFDIE